MKIVRKPRSDKNLIGIYEISPNPIKISPDLREISPESRFFCRDLEFFCQDLGLFFVGIWNFFAGIWVSCRNMGFSPIGSLFWVLRGEKLKLTHHSWFLVEKTRRQPSK